MMDEFVCSKCEQALEEDALSTCEKCGQKNLGSCCIDDHDCKPEGWGWPLNSKKAHYFIKGRSLCCRWMFPGLVEQGMSRSPDNCAACMKKLEKRK